MNSPSASPDWEEFYEVSKEFPPSPLLLEAMQFMTESGNALDLGAGALQDTRFLLSLGWKVTAVDRSPSLEEMGATLPGSKLKTIVSSFADYSFPENTYTLISSMYALPFSPPDSLQGVIDRLQKSLCPGGLFVGNFFGPQDGWSSNPEMTFLTMAEVKQMFSSFEILSLKEIERDNTLANGQKKHWHEIRVIARKLS